MNHETYNNGSWYDWVGTDTNEETGSESSFKREIEINNETYSNGVIFNWKIASVARRSSYLKLRHMVIK